jgi:lipoprotein signal peptidase
MKLQKVFYSTLFAAFFLLLHFWLRSWIMKIEDWTVICNQGWPFGVLLPEWFTLIGFGAIIFFFTQWWKEKLLIAGWPWLLIISGGAGNLLERKFFGCILDYIALPFFPVFNIADVLLTIGIIGILIKNVKVPEYLNSN